MYALALKYGFLSAFICWELNIKIGNIGKSSFDNASSARLSIIRRSRLKIKTFIFF
jgi:hypothetical protein